MPVDNASESMRGIRVLVVDDEPENRQILRVLLGREGYTVIEAANGIEAIHVAMREEPALILLDIGMPDLDGYQACERLKHAHRTAGIPIIFLTAMAGTADVVRGFQAGGVDYITKPFQSAELLARVRTHVRLRQLQQVLSVCSYCGRIRNDEDSWEPVETYIRNKTGADLSHGICPECYESIREQFPTARGDE